MPTSREIAFRVLGTLVGVGLGIMSGVWEAVLTPLYIGSVRSPLAVILALLGNAALVYFTYFVTRRVGLALLPGAAWLIMMLLAMYKTSEGDLIIIGTWVGALTFMLGCIGWAVPGYILIRFGAGSTRPISSGSASPSSSPRPKTRKPFPSSNTKAP